MYKYLLLMALVVGNQQAIAQENKPDSCLQQSSALDVRLCTEKKIIGKPFVLIPYKPIYFIGSYAYGLKKENPEFDNFEAKFQLSFKIPLSSYKKPARCLGIEGTKCVSFFAYTQRSIWQMFNLDHSAPFRDTNFEPEVMVSQLFNKRKSTNNKADWQLRIINYGLFNHQSNGKTPPFSRSWNRSYVDFVFEKENHYLTFKMWKRWQEEKKLDPNDYIGDDNENIEDYVGNVEIKYLHTHKGRNFSAVMRDSKMRSSKINIELNWSIPLRQLAVFSSESEVRFYIQYFNGYGETLIDFDRKRERLGVGLMLADWL